MLFIERWRWSLAPSGRPPYIIPFLLRDFQKYGMRVRKTLLEDFTLESVADLRTVKVFKSVPVITIIPVIRILDRVRSRLSR